MWAPSPRVVGTRPRSSRAGPTATVPPATVIAAFGAGVVTFEQAPVAMRYRRGKRPATMTRDEQLDGDLCGLVCGGDV